MDVKETPDGICIDGFRASGIKDVKYGVALIKADRVCEAAAVFTTCSIRGAHIGLDEERIGSGIQAIIVNSGNANAYVKDGLRDAEEMGRIASGLLGVEEKNVAVASTGITGRRIDLAKVRELAGKAAAKITDKAAGGMEAAKAIMTTDTMPKQLSYEYKGIKVGMIAKGSGMIAPNMATMLCFITTNADLGRGELQEALKNAADDSFNLLVVEGDMSPNDTVIVLSNRSKACEKEDFEYLLAYATKEMAKTLAKDAEGASKFFEATVRCAKTKEDARCGAKAIVTSPLVKTAIYGENPNWGRIIAALNMKLDFELEKTDMTFESEKGKAKILERGEMLEFEKAAGILKGKNIKVTVCIGEGNEEATAWGCDYTEEYVKINAGYN